MADTVHKEIVKVREPMKFVKRISLFFIYPIAMFGLGFAADMAIQEFFYPGEEQSRKREAVLQEEPAREAIQVPIPVMTADTEYVVMNYDMLTGKEQEEQASPPDKYIGITRQKLEAEIQAYEESPSLSDLEKGFQQMELLSFSPSKVVVRKSYERKEETGFFLLNEDHYVVVYDQSLSYVYMNTGICTRELPQSLQNEIMHMKYISSEEELYHFLESYSS